MGGHESKQSVHMSTKVAANIVQNTAQNCITVSYGGNNISINGNYNSVSKAAQQVTVSISSDCQTFASQNSTFNNDLENALTQALTDQEIALTQWLDNSKDDQSAYISNDITTNFTQNTVQKCVNNLTGINNLYVFGNGNVIKDVTQSATLNVISQCILAGQQTSDVVNNITNTANQQSTYESKNPFSFITDAIEAVAKSILIALAACFIVVVCFVALFAVLRRRGRAGARGPLGVAPSFGPAFGPEYAPEYAPEVA